MKLGIMQPYFLPYIGYWQLINAVDKYVIYDDVNYIKGGWVNRNNILFEGQKKYINVPMQGSSSFKKINEIRVNNDDKLISKTLFLIEQAYIKAPYYNNILPLLCSILKCGKDNLSEYLIESIHIICTYLDIETELIVSSCMEKDNELKAQDKVLAICEQLGATEYYNAVGGQELYAHDEFKMRNMKLRFLEPQNITYKQFGDEFYGNLSIVDVMMFNPRERIKGFLHEYILK